MVLIAAAFVATRGSREPDATTSPADTAIPAKPAPQRERAGSGTRPDDASSTSAARERADAAAAARADKGAPGTKRASRAVTSSKEKGASVGLPLSLARALAREDAVVLFFRQRRGADDEATAAAVSFARSRAGNRVAVFTDRVENLADYRLVIGSLGVTQAPSVVIVGADKRAKLLEGYVDGPTVLQQVTDTLR
jgi:hypothetical protein